MKKLVLILVVFGLALGFSTQASAEAIGPDDLDPGTKLEDLIGYNITVDDSPPRSVPYGLIKGPNSDKAHGFGLDKDITLKFGEDTVTISKGSGGLFDPVLNLAIGFTDNDSASTVGIGIVSPISLPPGTTSVKYTIDLLGSFTDGASDGGSIAVAGFQSFGVMDVSLNGAPIDGVGGGAAFPTPASFYGAFNKAGTFDAASFTTFDIILGFTGSGGGDTYALNGRFEVLPVPEPATMLLIGTGLLGLAGLSRRFRKN